MNLFRTFTDTSFSDHRQVRVVLQELSHQPLDRSSVHFQR